MIDNCQYSLSDQSSSQLSAKTSLNYQLADSIDVKMSEKSQLKITYFCKMIVLFSILKQLPTVLMVKLRRFICCVGSYYHSWLQLLPHFSKKIACILNVCQFTCNLHKIQRILTGLVEIFIGTKIYVMIQYIFNCSVFICSIKT